MASTKGTPKKPPARAVRGKKQVQPSVVREVIVHPAERISSQQQASINKLKATVKGAPRGKGKARDGATPLKPLPPNFHRKPDGSMMTPNEFYNTYAASGQYDVQQSQINAYTQIYNQSVAAEKHRNNPLVRVVEAVEGVAAIVTDIPGIVAGDAASIADANAQAAIVMQAVRGDYTRIQTSVGGTKGTPKPVDRSAAIRKAWATRKKLYGSSGQKDK
jgi:hypothetical protein